MEDYKRWYTSRAVWGAIVAMISSIMLMSGHHLTPDMQGAMIELGLQAGSLIGGGLALYGRLTAKKAIGPTAADEAE
jgi:hypothetical protein